MNVSPSLGLPGMELGCDALPEGGLQGSCDECPEGRLQDSVLWALCGSVEICIPMCESLGDQGEAYLQGKAVSCPCGAGNS